MADAARLRPLIVIPARMAASRLPGKPLADICGKPMIVRVWEVAQRWAAGVEGARVVVAAGEAEIADAVTAAGGEAVLTEPDLPSGTDRVWAAAQIADPKGASGAIVNLQGDQPVFDPAILDAVVDALADEAVDISTLASVITDDHERGNPNVVKAVASFADGASIGRALYFTRTTAPWGEGPLLHHIGIYGFRRPALERFVGLAPSPLEQREKLEQLRALENGMRIDVAVVEDSLRIGVDTPEDLERARAYYARAN